MKNWLLQVKDGIDYRCVELDPAGRPPFKLHSQGRPPTLQQAREGSVAQRGWVLRFVNERPCSQACGRDIEDMLASKTAAKKLVLLFEEGIVRAITEIVCLF